MSYTNKKNESVKIYSLKISYRCCGAVFCAFVVSGCDLFSHPVPLGTAVIDPNDQSEIMSVKRKRNPEQQEISNNRKD